MAVAARSIQRTRWIKLQVFRYVVFALAVIFFLVPLGAMVELALRHGARSPPSRTKTSAPSPDAGARRHETGGQPWTRS